MTVQEVSPVFSVLGSVSCSTAHPLPPDTGCPGTELDSLGAHTKKTILDLTIQYVWHS